MTDHQRLIFLRARCMYFRRADTEAQARLLGKSFMMGPDAFAWRVAQTVARLRRWHHQIKDRGQLCLP